MKKGVSAVISLLSFSALTFAQNSIRQIDFNNFTYPVYCGDEEARQIAVKNSDFFQEIRLMKKRRACISKFSAFRTGI